MAVYPTNPIPRFQSKRGKQRGAIRTESEASYGMTRNRFTKSRPFFSLNYENITNEQYSILESFFETYQGQIFDFVYPKEPTKTYRVMFNMDKIEATDTNPNRCTTSVELVGV